MVLLVLLLHVIPSVAAGCRHDDFHFHRAVEEAWSEDFGRENSRREDIRSHHPGFGEDVGLLAKDRMGSLKRYCDCQEGEEPSDFCRVILISYHSSQQRDRRQKTQPSNIEEQRKEHLKESRAAVILSHDISPPLHSFILAVAKELLVHHVVILLADTSLPPAIFSLAKASLATGLALTVRLAGGNISQAVLQAGDQSVGVFVLGGRTCRVVREVSGW